MYNGASNNTQKEDEWIRKVSYEPVHFAGTQTAQSMLKWGITTGANLVRRPKACNATSVKRAKRPMPKRKEPSFTVAIIPNKRFWTVWRCWRIAIAWQPFIGSKGSKKKPCVNGCNELPSTWKRLRPCC